MADEIAVYKAYLLTKTEKGKTAVQVARDFGITRSGLYEIIRRIENGNVAKIRRCTEQSKLDCLWEYKYKARFAAIPKDRKAASVDALRLLIRDMHKEKFPIANIAARIGRDRSTVLHHIDN